MSESTTTTTTEAPKIEETEVIRRPGQTKLMDSLDGMHTVQEVFEYAVKEYRDLPCLGKRPIGADGKPCGDFEWMTYEDLAKRVGAFGRGFQKVYVAPERPEKEETETETETTTRPVTAEGVDEDALKIVGIYSINRVEWTYTDMALVEYGYCGVPLYDTLGPDAVKHIIQQTRMATVCCSADKVGKLLALKAECPSIRVVVQFEDVDAASVAAAAEQGVTLLAFGAVSAQGALSEAESAAAAEAAVAADASRTAFVEAALAGHVQRSGDEVHSIVYTSGTSGGAKGVMIKNRAFIAGIGGTIDHLRTLFVPRVEAILSFLPLAHVLERQVFVIAIYFGARVGMFSGHISGLMDDLAALRPTVFFAVPRLFNKVYAAFQEKIKTRSWLARTLFAQAFARKRAAIEAAQAARTPAPFQTWYDGVFAQLRAGLGGRVKLIITGSAPLAPEIHRFLQVCFCCNVVQGYGMTEGYPVSVTGVADPEPLHCGPLMAHCEMKLRDVPDLGFRVRDTPHPRGEALIHGAHVFSGYFRNPAVTQRVLSPDGWFATGDVVELIDGNRIRVIGRCKEVIKLAQGEFVVIEEVENAYCTCPIVAQIFVYGDPLREFLVAVVEPDPRELRRVWDAVHGAADGASGAAETDGAKTTTTDSEPTMAQMCSDPAVKQRVLEMFNETHKKSGMTGINRVRDLFLDPEGFSTENGVMTPTNKLAREVAKKHYADVIKRMYDAAAPGQ